MKTVKTIARIFLYFIVSVMIGYCIFVLNAKFVLHEQLPMLAGYGHAVVLSGSMEPEIHVDDLLFIQKCESYEVGDVVTYVDKTNDLVTHRLIEIDEVTAVTKGDANNIADAPFRVERIKGKVVGIVPAFGKVVTIVQNPMVVAVAIVLVLFINHVSYSAEKERKDEKLDELRAQIEALKAEQQDNDKDEAEKLEEPDGDEKPDDTEKAEPPPDDGAVAQEKKEPEDNEPDEKTEKTEES